jgi:hypothetical protein
MLIALNLVGYLGLLLCRKQKQRDIDFIIYNNKRYYDLH